MTVLQIEMQAGNSLPDASNNVFEYEIFIKSAIRDFSCYATSKFYITTVFQIEMQAGSLLPDASNNVFKYNIFIKSAIRYFLCYAWMVKHKYLVIIFGVYS